MKKGLFTLLILAGLCFCASATAAETLEATANLPGATAIKPHISKVMGDGKQASNWPLPNTPSEKKLDFGKLELLEGTDLETQKPFKVFLPDHFFAIDVGYTYGDGANISQITTQYTEGVKPAGQKSGLGQKSTAALVKKAIVNGVETEPLPFAIRLLSNNGAELNESVLLSTLGGGWLRLYVGIVAKPSDTGILTAEVFSPGDLPGQYSGTLIISAL